MFTLCVNIGEFHLRAKRTTRIQLTLNRPWPVLGFDGYSRKVCFRRQSRQSEFISAVLKPSTDTAFPKTIAF